MQISCDSQIDAVTVYARGAVVRRRVHLPPELPAGEVELRVAGVTPLCEAGSLRARVLGTGRTVVAVRSALRVPESAPLVGPSMQAVRTLVARIQRLQAEQAHLEARRKKLLEQALDPKLKAPSPLERIGGRIGDALFCAGGLQEIAAELDARLVALGEELRELEEQREAAALRDAQAQSRARLGAGHPRRDLFVRLVGQGAIDGLELSYVVLPARFWPVYTLRLAEGGRSAELLLEALVTQLSGEDWSGVRLGLSTADLLYDARLPELPSLRFGRAQAPRRAFRPPPEGLERMFAGYDRVFGAAARAEVRRPPEAPALGADDAVPPEIEAIDTGRYGEEDLASFESALLADDESVPTQVMARQSAPRPAPGAPPPARRALPPAPPPAALAPQMMSMPLPAPAAARARGGAVGAVLSAMAEATSGLYGGLGGGPAEAAAPPPPEPEPVEPDDAWLNFDALTLAGPDGGAGRGRLRRTGDAQLGEQRRAAARIEQVTPPIPGTQDPRASRGRFDHRYDAEGLCDVPSDGLCHRVMLGAAQAEARPRFRTVPREAPEVYREVQLVNPLAAPLLAGPVDVYVEGSLLIQTAVEAIDRGGAFTVGMGVEERLRVARNARSEEESAGVLGGSLAVTHSVTIELSSALGHDVTVEVIDRIPVTDDKSVEIKRTAMKPEGEPYKQTDRGQPLRGGWLWRVPLPAGKRAQVEFQYRVTLPAKSEIIGGNRRE